MSWPKFQPRTFVIPSYTQVKRKPEGFPLEQGGCGWAAFSTGLEAERQLGLGSQEGLEREGGGGNNL